MSEEKKIGLDELRREEEAKMNIPVTKGEFYSFADNLGTFVNELKYDFITLYTVLLDKGIITETEIAKAKKKLKEDRKNPPMTASQIVAQDISLEDKIKMAKDNGLEGEIDNIVKFHELKNQEKENERNES